MKYAGYIILAILALVVLWLLFGGKAKAAEKTATASASPSNVPFQTLTAQAAVPPSTILAAIEAQGGYGATATHTGSLASEVNQLLESSSSGMTSKQCRQTCGQLCAPVPMLRGRAQKAGWQRGRDACKDNCRSDCAGGQDVRKTYPDAWRA